MAEDYGNRDLHHLMGPCGSGRTMFFYVVDLHATYLHKRIEIFSSSSGLWMFPWQRSWIKPEKVGYFKQYLKVVVKNDSCLPAVGRCSLTTTCLAWTSLTLMRWSSVFLCQTASRQSTAASVVIALVDFTSLVPSPPVDVIWAMRIVWRIRGKIIRTVLWCVV